VFNVPVDQKLSTAQCSIVEDGILVRLPRHSFNALRTALRSGENFAVTESESADVTGVRGEELVVVQWIDDASRSDPNEK